MKRARRVDDLRAPAVVEGDEERDAVVAGGQLLGPLHPLDELARGTGASRRPMKRMPHALLVQLGRLARRCARRTSPSAPAPPRSGATSSRSRTSRPSAPRSPSSTASRSRALTLSAPARWPVGDGQPALLGPAAVAVGDDRDVAGRARRPRRRRRRATARPQTSRISSSLCFSSAVELGDLLVGELLQLDLGAVLVVGRRPRRRPQLAQVVHHVAADVADRDAALLGDVAHDLDELACGAPRSARGSPRRIRLPSLFGVRPTSDSRIAFSIALIEHLS